MKIRSIGLGLSLFLFIIAVSLSGCGGGGGTNDNTANGPFSIIQPSENATVGSLTPTISWTVHPSATRYFFYVGKDIGGGDGTYQTVYMDYVTSTTVSLAAYPLESKSKYYLQIDAYNGTSLLANVNRRFFTP